MGDQVFVYKLTKTSGWSVTTREASIKEINVASGSKLGVSWSSNKVTLSNTMTAADMPMSSSDATTTSSAIAAINSKPTVNAIQKNSIDLNTLVIPGVYACNHCTNTPNNVDSWFNVEVLPNGGGGDGNANYAIQIATMLGSAITYKRVRDNGTWGSWAQLATTDRLSNAKILHFNNANSIVVDLGYIPSTSSFGHIFLWNANRHLMAMILPGESSTSYDKIGTSDMTFTFSRSDSVLTITPSSTMWGVTTIILDRN